jgi:hypothetical protein
VSDEKKRDLPSGTLERARAALERAPAKAAETPASDAAPEAKPRDKAGGPDGPDPTRYGDWERKGRCIDF